MKWDKGRVIDTPGCIDGIAPYRLKHARCLARCLARACRWLIAPTKIAVVLLTAVGTIRCSSACRAPCSLPFADIYLFIELSEHARNPIAEFIGSCFSVWLVCGVWADARRGYRRGVSTIAAGVSPPSCCCVVSLQKRRMMKK